MREKSDLPVEESLPTPKDLEISVRQTYVEACQQAHRQMVEVQSSFQSAMTEAHISFMKAMEVSLTDLKNVVEDVGSADTAQPLEAQPPEAEPPAPVSAEELPSVVASVGESSSGESSSGESSTGLPSSSLPSSVAESPVGTDSSFGRYALHAEPVVPVGLAISGLASSRLVVTDEGTGVARALVEQLQARGVQAEVVEEVPSDATGVILLSGLGPIESRADTVAANLAAFRAASKVASRLTTGSGVFITVQDTGGDFGLSGRGGERAGLAGLAGLAKTVRLEWPGATVKAIDLERGSRPVWKVAKVLAEEIFCGGPEIEVGLDADGGRISLETHPALLNLGMPEGVYSVVGRGALHQNSVLVASGGARGITAATLIALARNARPRVVLLGRTVLEEEPLALRDVDGEDALRQALRELGWSQGRALAAEEFEEWFQRILASREVRSNLVDLRQAGSEVRYYSVDIQDGAAVAEVLAEARRDWGPITGLIHGAGARVDRPLAEKTERDFDRVFRTKVSGLFNLLESTAEDPLELILLFSSAAARTGQRGLAEYAMANEVLNKVAWSEYFGRGGGCLVKALNWSLWEGGRVVTEEAGDGGEQAIPIDVGARMLVEEIQAGLNDQVEVILGAPPRIEATTGPRFLSMLTMDAFVSATTHPFLEGHRIDDAPELPVSLVLEWFTRITRGHCRDLEMLRCRDLRVLRAVKLDRFYEGGDAFTVVSHLHPRDPSKEFHTELHLELYARDGSLRFTAIAEMAAPGTMVSTSDDTARLIRASQSEELRPWPFSSIYGHALGHGPECQVIREIRGVSEEGLVATLAGAHEMGWLEEWKTDVAALDGGVQLVNLWFQHKLGGTAMVTRLGSYNSHFSGLVEGPIRAVLRGQSEGFRQVVCDVVFVNENGTLVGELNGVEARIFIKPAILPEPDVSVELEDDFVTDPASGVPAAGVPASGVPASGVPVEADVSAAGVSAAGAPAVAYSPDWLDKATRMAALLEGLLNQADPRSVLSFSDPVSGNLVRFVGGEGKVFLDIPGEALGSRRMKRAEAFFAGQGIEKDITEIYQDGELTESRETFGLDLGKDIERATQIALDIFSQVYGLPDDFLLNVRHS